VEFYTTHRLKNKREDLDLSSGTRIPELIVELSLIEMKENERKVVKEMEINERKDTKWKNEKKIILLMKSQELRDSYHKQGEEFRVKE